MDIPKVTRWDGNYKSFTKDCDGCNWYRKIENQDLCGWGVAFKYLQPTENPRACEVKNRKQNFILSAKYLDKVLANIENEL